MKVLILAGLMSFASGPKGPFIAEGYQEDHTHGSPYKYAEQRSYDICNGQMGIRLSDWITERIDTTEAHGYHVSAEFVCP
ncbi:hypothetical protein CIK05_03630 [Bdellovibrio sp. qaytius]|nr:hypothetical protein CIK05_03630 [Bdellovibrio sp. qaytius]